MQTCTNCKETKPLQEFHKNRTHRSGYHNECKLCVSVRNTGYRHSRNGILTEIWSDQKKSSVKRGDPPPSYTKEELGDWMLSQTTFHNLFYDWAESGYKKDLKPSCDRTDDYQGYSLDRLQLVTWGENRTKAHLDRRNGINNKGSKAVLQSDLNGNFIKEYCSTIEACRETGVSRANIRRCCVGDGKRAGNFTWAYKSEASI